MTDQVPERKEGEYLDLDDVALWQGKAISWQQRYEAEAKRREQLEGAVIVLSGRLRAAMAREDARTARRAEGTPETEPDAAT